MNDKVEFSKKILYCSYCIAVSLTLCMVVGMFLQIDVIPLENVTLASWGEVTVANGFYYWKARKENEIKLMKSLPKHMRDQIDANQIID